METYFNAVQDAEGNAITGASVTVRGAENALATIFDASGVEITNPITTGPLGGFEFAAANGDYTIEISGNGVVARQYTVSLFKPETISVSDYAKLVTTVNAKSPGDAASHVATSFPSWRNAIQAALDDAFTRGGGTVILPWRMIPYLIDDYVVVKSNTRLINEAEIKLGDYTTIGGAIMISGDNIELQNPRVDCSGIFAGGSGENGICSYLSASNIRIHGGYVKNCARGNAGGKFGGKGFQFESTFGEVRVESVYIENCFMGMSSLHDYAEVTACGSLAFTNITAKNCGMLGFVRQSGGSDITGLTHSVTFNGITATNCGSHQGVFQFSRAAAVKVSNVLVMNSASVDCLIRGNIRYSSFDNVQLNGDCTALINLDPSDYAVDMSNAQTNNTYDIKHNGVAAYVVNASLSTNNRVLVDSSIRAHLSTDVTTKLAGDELRNAFCRMDIQQGGKSITTTTAALYVGGKAKFADFVAGITLPRTDAAGTWVPVDNSGAGLTLATAYGDYVKIGPLVMASFRVTFPTTATTFVARIAGLPYAAANVSSRVTSGMAIRYTDQGAFLTGSVTPGGTEFLLCTATGATINNASMSGKTLDAMVMYFTTP